MSRIALNLEASLYRLVSRLKRRSRTGEIPADARAYLSTTNPRLLELKEQYAALQTAPHSFWAHWEAKIDLLRFRGEDDFVSQAYFRNTEIRYAITYAYVEALDDAGLLDVLREDDLFGANTRLMPPGRVVSRDLLDSISEIGFLADVLSLPPESAIRVLDIGAGYGRFADRFCRAYPRSSVTCIDAVATSTFLCDFYLRFRGRSNARVVPFHQRGQLAQTPFDLAVNIHSWSECTREFIRQWLKDLSEIGVPALMIVPHAPELVSKERDGSRLPYLDDLRDFGWDLVVRRPKYHRSKLAQERGIFPTDYWFFRRRFTSGR